MASVKMQENGGNVSNVHDIFKLGDEQHDAPVGMSFAPSGWIAPFTLGHVYAVGWVEMDLAQLQKDEAADLTTALETVDEETEKPFAEMLAGDDGQMFDEARESRSNKFKYYYRDYDRAMALVRLLDAEEPAYSKAGEKFHRKPEHRVRLETQVADVLSLSDEAKAKFERAVVSWEVELKGIQKNSPNWFIYHGLFLPCLVSAYSQLMGWKADAYDIGELTKPEDEVIVTDKFQVDMIGNTYIGLEASALWVRRKLLWSQLKEDDPKTSNPDDTASDMLKSALTVAASDWQAPVYCRVLQVPSPKVDDVWDGKRGRVRSRIPVITDFYRSKSEAETAAEADRAERGGDEAGEAKSAKAAAGPAVPEAWAEIPDDWAETVRTIKAEIGTKPLPIVKKALTDMKQRLADEFMVTADDMLAWWNEV